MGIVNIEDDLHEQVRRGEQGLVPLDKRAGRLVDQDRDAVRDRAGVELR